MSKPKSTPAELAAIRRENNLIQQNRQLMQHCKGCRFAGTVLSMAFTTCDYTYITGKVRPCNIGANCTVRESGRRSRKAPEIRSGYMTKLTAITAALVLFGAGIFPISGKAVYEPYSASRTEQTAHIATLSVKRWVGYKTPRVWTIATPPSRREVLSRFTEEERYALAKLLWGEARGIPSDTEKAAVIWCALNRVDSPDPYYPDTILGVVKQKGQFAGYSANHPVDEHLLWIVDDVLYRWATDGEGRVLPIDYLFFASKASEGYSRNYFRKLFRDPGPRWDWSLPSPYEN